MIIIVLLVIVGGYFILRGGYQAPVPSAPTSTETAPTPTKAEETGQTPQEFRSPAIKEVTVIGTEFSFNPSNISLEAGERVRIIFKNQGRAPHNLVIEGLGIATRTIGGGQTDTIEFTASSSGVYTFFCSVFGHRTAGMEGTLNVK